MYISSEIKSDFFGYPYDVLLIFSRSLHSSHMLTLVAINSSYTLVI